ncbi:efflux transporter outer membrane subunit [uncultured Desulfosarcina sp.]|uniref:efflux transporter outer membrane subunit n=1 Tax=uncultured Desulfosarcina sp. TaxID=218289 RepID=UPI0029C75DD3|nr:efflux transporter outer membrane subunit [uncultured Desulfosarcina sp.]
MRRLMVLSIVLLIAGCTVGPDYVKPVVDVPPVFNNGDHSAQQAANVAWWKQFNDPALDALIAEALANNRDVKIALANIDQAAAVFTQSRSTLYPQIGYGGSGTRERASETDAARLYTYLSNPRTSYQALASASWELDLWGRIRRLSEAARAELLATEAAWQGVILSLVSSVATSYIQLLGLDAQFQVAERTLATYAESLRIFETRFKYGQVSEMTVVQARSQYETAAAAIPQFQSQIKQAENALSILLGRNPGTIQRQGTLHELKMPPVPAELPSDLLTNRPDIRQAEEGLIAANANIGAARALYFPTISLTGAFGFASSDLSDLFKGSSRAWNYAGSLTGPIFMGGAIKSGVKQTEAAREAALWAYEKTIQSAFADAENALIAQRQLVEQVRIQERLVAANSEYVRLAHLQYDGGYVPYSTVLQAEQQLFPSELNYAQTRATLLSSLVTVYKAMGGGWQPAVSGEKP